MYSDINRNASLSKMCLTIKCVFFYNVIPFLVKYLHMHLFEMRGVNPPVDVQVTT